MSYFRDWMLLIFDFDKIGTKGFGSFKLPGEIKACLIRRDVLEAGLMPWPF